jgi:hypothetical protein
VSCRTGLTGTGTVLVLVLSFRTVETLSAALPRAELSRAARETLPVLLLRRDLTGRTLLALPITLLGGEGSCGTQVAGVVPFLVAVLSFPTQLTLVKFAVVSVRGPRSFWTNVPLLKIH